jgi:hypothetical protein
MRAIQKIKTFLSFKIRESMTSKGIINKYEEAKDKWL